MGSSNPPKLNKFAAEQRKATGSSQPVATSSVPQLNPNAKIGGLVDYTAAFNIMEHNRERTSKALDRLRADNTAAWEERRRQAIYNSRVNNDTSLAAQMLKDRAALSQQHQTTKPGLDDNSLAYQMLKDRAASEKNQQSLPLAQRIQNISTPGTYSVSDYADLAKSFTGTPAQDALDAYVKERTDYWQYLKAPDFQKYSKLGADIQNPSFSDAQGLFSLFGLRPGAQEVGNIVTFSRDNIEKIQEKLDSDDRSTFVGNALYSFMSEDEVGIYNYLLAKEGKGAAARYLEAIEETLNARYGAKVAADVNNSKLLKPVLTAGVATSAGLDRYAQNIKQLANEYRLPTSAVQFTGQEVRKDLGALGRVAYDVVNQISYQAPSILVNYVAGAIGAPAKLAEWAAAASTGLSAAGGSYNQALAEGRSKDEAKTVSALIGASEAVLSKLLSGIGAYGGLTSEKLLPKVAAIENAAWRVLGAAGVKIGGEVSEELLQEFLEPLFKTAVYGDEYDAPTIEALAYTAFVTALTTGIMEGGEIAKFRTPEGARAAAGVEQTSESKVSEKKTSDAADSMAPAGSQSVSEVGSDLGRGKVADAPRGSQTVQEAPASIGEHVATDFDSNNDTQSREESIPPQFDRSDRQTNVQSQVAAPSQHISQDAAKTQRAMATDDEIRRRVFEAQIRAKYGNTVEKSETKSYTESDEKRGVTNGSDEVRLREGSEWTNSTDPTGSVPSMESNAGQNQSWTVQRGFADGEISRVSYGEKVSTAQLGIEGGSNQDSVYLVGSNNTSATKAAQQIADERGLELVLFAGGDLHTAAAPNGARGFTDGKKIFARADDPDFTAEQITRHEAGHDMIARGEIDLDNVRDRIASRVGSENVETAAKLYAMAYAGSGLSADEVWEECICDSLGEMNVFVGTGSDVETFMGGFVDAAKQEAEVSRQVPRGPPEVGKSQHSRRIGGEVNGKDGSEETRRSAFTGDDTLRWESDRVGHRRAEESRESFLARMGQSRSALRSFGEILYGYQSVSVKEASDYAKETAEEFDRLGVKDYFIFDGEVQANDSSSTFGDGSDGLTLKDGFIGINNKAADSPGALAPKNVAAHEAIHHKLANQDQAAEVYKLTVIENLLVDSELFYVYWDAINDAYFSKKLDLKDETQLKKFFEEFSAFVSGHIYGNVRDVSGMFADYDAVCSALETALGVKLPGRVSQRLSTEELIQEIDRIREEGRSQGRSEEDVIEDIRAAVDEVYQSMIEVYGAIEPGEKPYREIEVPRRTLKDNKVSQTVRTILEAQATPDEALPDIEELVARGDFSYDVYSDKAAIADARERLEKNWTDELAHWYARMDRGEVSKANTAMGWALYNNAVNRGDTDMALTILDKIVKHQRNAAQAVQATRILKKLSPETQLYQIQRTVEGLQQDLFDRYGEEKSPTLKIDPELAEQFLRSETQEERDTVTRKIYQKVGQQMPSTFRDKWNAWRYLAMLGNPRTHVRNIIGNAGFVPVVAAKNLTATAIESVVSRVSGGKFQRTKSFVGFSEKDRGLMKAAWADYAVVEGVISSGGKYDDLNNSNKLIAQGQKVFKTKWLESVRKKNSNLLEAEDVWFSRPHYAAALASFCKTNRITPEDIANGKNLDKARVYAIREAQKATYKDSNALSWLLTRKFSEKGEYGSVGKVANTFMEGVLPFRKTPANILARGLEYSPVGLLNGIKQAVWDVHKGTKTGAEAIDSISAGLTGTGLLALGMWMAAESLVRGAGGSDEKEKTFEELMGHQTYSLEVGGKSHTLDWLAPEALPFFVGVNIWEQMSEREEKALTLKDLLEATTNLSEPLLEMSCLQSLNDMLDAVGYAQSNGMNGLGTIITSVATSYLTQIFPTLFGQIERVAEDQRETTYTEKEAFLTNDLQYLLGNISNKLPVEFQQIPFIDAWGRTESTGSVGDRIVSNMLNPAYLSEIDTSPMEEELIRLYEVTGENVFPSRADKYFNVDKKRKNLTAEEYVAYATERGQTARKILTDLTGHNEYKKLAEADKAAVVGHVYDLANAQAKMKVSDYQPDGWVAKALKCIEDTGVSPELYVICYQIQKDIEGLKDKDGETIPNSKGLLIMQEIHQVRGLSSKQKRAMYAAFGVGKSVIGYTPQEVKTALGKMRKQ